MTKHPADSSIIATFAWPSTVEYILGHFRRAGTPTTVEHIEAVWERAKTANLLPPLPRPAEGFDPRGGAMLVDALAQYAHDKSRSEHSGSSA